ncbi:MAG: hypothetical protein J1F01_00250 [Oscillospiraceae bacterium]|nr:hypothetical protein [Oscillospiraceae bacterium]
MKNYIKGVLTGFLIAAVLFAIPVLAENIDALFNSVRINVNGVDEIQWGENIYYRSETPSSILYNGTTYLPMRRLAEMSGQKIYWNGDSNTVSMTGKQGVIIPITEKPDKNGNVWEYYRFTDDNKINYLAVKDKARGYERVYRLGSESIRVTGDEIYFLRDVELTYRRRIKLIRLPFANDENTQDGEELYTVEYFTGGLIDGDYIFCLNYHYKGTSNQYGEIIAYNYINGEESIYNGGRGVEYKNIAIKESNNDKVTLNYNFTYSSHRKGEGEITFDKTTNTFGEPQETVREE